MYVASKCAESSNRPALFRLLKNLLRLVDPEYAQLLERWVVTLSLENGDGPKQRKQQYSDALLRSF